MKYLHPLLEQVCSETYGIFVYQEQVMQAAQVLAGYTLGGADLLRRAMGKKDKEKMAKEREKFVDGAGRLHKISADKANEIFDLLDKFAGYGFNRSHSAAYAWISYQTAFLKANYPVEFMAAVMSNEISNTDKISIFVGECERMGIRILAPDVNKSGLKFSPEDVSEEGIAAAKAARHAKAEATEADAPVEDENIRFEELPAAAEHRTSNIEHRTSNEPGERLHIGSIRYGLAAIKNVGEVAMEAAIAERGKSGEFKSIEDFCARVDSKKIGKKAVECLVKCGAFDFLNVERAQLHSEIDAAMASAASAHRDRASGQISMFDDFAAAAPPTAKRAAAKVPPWSHTEQLAFEKELLGFYVTGHPLDEYRSALAHPDITPIGRLPEKEEKATVTIAGALTSVEKKFTKKDSKPFAVVVLEDLGDQLEVMIWNETFTKSAALLEVGNVVSIKGRLDLREEGPRVTANEIRAIKKPALANRPLVLKFDRRDTTEADLLFVHNVLTANPGDRRVEFVFVGEDGIRLRMTPAAKLAMNISKEVEHSLERWLQR